MQFSTLLVSALAAFASAAPTASTTEVEPRGNVNLQQFNNLKGFNNLDLNYLVALNNINLAGLNQLAQVNNLNLNAFQAVFAAQNFDLNALLQLQQLNVLLQFQQAGLFNNAVNLAQVNLGGLNFGLINNLNGVNLGQFVDQNLINQINQVVQNSPLINIGK